MKLLASLSVLIIILGCSSPKRDQAKTSRQTANPKEKTSEKINSESEGEVSPPVTFQTSTYDDPDFADALTGHKAFLKRLFEEGVFSSIHEKQIRKLNTKHQTYFTSHPDYLLLASAKGNLFRENKTDYGFIVYDQKNQRVSILIYRETTNKYAELFRDLKVENGLENADCNYSSFGTIDYQLADEIIYQEESLIKNPENYLESSPIKITDISKNEDFFLKEGCFSKNVSKKDTAHSLCIATSCVYNNWEALRYNETNDSFVIYYGQAFAD